MVTLGHKKLFSLGFTILLSIVTEWIVVRYYWTNLDGWDRVICAGMLGVFWTTIWAAWWYVAEESDMGVKRRAFLVTIAMSIMMVFNAGMVWAATKVARAEGRGQKVAMYNSAQRMQELKAMDPRVAREIVKQEAALAKAEAERTERAELARKASGEDQATWGDWAKEYCSFLVFIVPLLSALLGKALLGYEIMKPGGAKGYLPTSGNKGQDRGGAGSGPDKFDLGRARPATAEDYRHGAGDRGSRSGKP